MAQPPDAKALRPLTEKQRAFADAFVLAKIKGLDVRQEDMARAAGYRGTPDALAVTASRTLRIPAVRAYLRDQAREHMEDGGMDVAVALRALTAQQDDKRVRLDAAKTLGLALGLTAREDQGGHGITLNLMFAGNGAALVQAPGDAAQVVEAIQEKQRDRSLVQGEGRRPPVRMVTAPLLDDAQPEQGGGGGRGGDFGREGKGKGGGGPQLPPQTVGVVDGDAPKISGPAKPAKVRVAVKKRAKAKKRRVVRKPRGGV